MDRAFSSFTPIPMVRWKVMGGRQAVMGAGLWRTISSGRRLMPSPYDTMDKIVLSSRATYFTLGRMPISSKAAMIS